MAENIKRFSQQEIASSFLKAFKDRGPIPIIRVQDPFEYIFLHFTVKKYSICKCKNCNTINEYAKSNQDDGTYLCYNCR